MHPKSQSFFACLHNSNKMWLSFIHSQHFSLQQLKRACVTDNKNKNGYKIVLSNDYSETQIPLSIQF